MIQLCHMVAKNVNTVEGCGKCKNESEWTFSLRTGNGDCTKMYLILSWRREGPGNQENSFRH